METKKGIKIPDDLAERLRKSKTLKSAWDKLRPSCQRDYVKKIKNAPNEVKRKTKIERVIELTIDYAERHPEKYQN